MIATCHATAGVRMPLAGKRANLLEEAFRALATPRMLAAQGRSGQAAMRLASREPSCGNVFSSKENRAPLKPRGLRLGGFAWAARAQNYVAFALALAGLDLLNNSLPLDASILPKSPRDVGVARELCRGQPLAKEAAFKGGVGDGQKKVDSGLVAVGDAPHEGCPAMVGLGIGIADRQEQGHAFKVAGHRGMHQGGGAIG